MKKVSYLDLKNIRSIVLIISIASLFILNAASVYSYVISAPDYCINQDLFIPDQEWIKEGVAGSNLSDPVKFCTEICLSRYKCNGYGKTAKEKVCQEIEDPCLPIEISNELFKMHETRCYESCKNKYFGFKIEGDIYPGYNSETGKKGGNNNENDNSGDVYSENDNSGYSLIGLPVNYGSNISPCIGEAPKNSKLCQGDDREVSYYTKKKLVNTCSAPEGSEPKCEYVCKTKYLDGGVCKEEGFFKRFFDWFIGLF